MSFLALSVDTELVPKSRRGHIGCGAGIPFRGNSGFDCNSPGLTLLLKGTENKAFPFRTHTICRES